MNAKAEILQHLAQRIREIEAAATVRHQTGTLKIPLLDFLLEGRALRSGALLELASAAEGAGAWTLALFLAQQACSQRRTLVVVDPRGWFYPPAAAALGFDLDNVILLRPPTRSAGQAALDQALRCTAVGAVVGWCERLRPAEAQRLRLAVEVGGGLGLLLGPAQRGASVADLRLVVTPLARAGTSRQVRIEVARWRGGGDGRTILLEIDHETGHVHLPAGLAAAATGS
jgi:protein ImuA